MVSWRSLLGRIKRLNITVAEDGGSYELVNDGEYLPCPLAESANDHRNASEMQEFNQPALKGLDLLHIWPKNTTSLCMEWCTMVGRICLLIEPANYYPETGMNIRPITSDTQLYLALSHGHYELSRCLVESLKRADCFEDVINRRDRGGQTTLLLATFRKQLHNLMEERPLRQMLEVNTKTGDAYPGLDITDVLPDNKENELEIEKTLQTAGAFKGRDIDEKKPDSGNHEVHIELGNHWDRPLHQQVTRSEFPTINYHGLLLTATLLATTTFHAALRAAPGISDAPLNETGSTFLIEEQDAEINKLFILFNSVVFFMSLALITVLTHELPIKPWLQILLFSAIGAYICLIMTVSPHEVDSVVFIGCFFLLATFLKCLSLDSILLDCLQKTFKNSSNIQG